MSFVPLGVRVLVYLFVFPGAFEKQVLSWNLTFKR